MFSLLNQRVRGAFDDLYLASIGAKGSSFPGDNELLASSWESLLVSGAEGLKSGKSMNFLCYSRGFAHRIL